MEKKPLFQQIRDAVAQRIASGALQPGDKAPTELELCDEFGTTRMTVRRAIEVLVDEHLLIRQGRKGTFVAPHRWEREMNRFHSLAEDLQRRGIQTVTKVLDIRVTEPPEEVAAQLQIAPTERVIHMYRLRLVGDEPLVLMEDYIPLRRCPGILEDDFTGSSLYQLLEEKHGFKVAAGRQTIYLQRLLRREAQLLGVKAGDAAMAMRALVYLEDGSPLLLGTYLFRGDSYSFSVTLPRR